MKNTVETRLGIFVALMVISAVVILEVLGGFPRFRGGYHLRAMFESVQELKAGDPVKMAGVQIGTVSSLALTNSKVLVTLRIDRDKPVHTDSKASIKFTGLLGQNYVSLDFGSPDARVFTDGQQIETVEQADLGQLMAKLDHVATGIEKITETFSGDQIQNLLGPLTDFVKKESSNLSGTISNIHNISGQIASGQGTIGKLIYTDTLHESALAAVTNLQSAAAEATLTLADARKVVDDINAGHGTLGKLAHDEALYNEATASMTNLHNILLKIDKGEGTVGKLINEDSFLKNAKLTLQKLDRATEGLEDQGPMTVLGTVAGHLF